jgi:hypothetical protein
MDNCASFYFSMLKEKAGSDRIRVILAVVLLSFFGLLMCMELRSPNPKPVDQRLLKAYRKGSQRIDLAPGEE